MRRSSRRVKYRAPVSVEFQQPIGIQILHGPDPWIAEPDLGKIERVRQRSHELRLSRAVINTVEEEAIGKAYDSRLMGRLLAYMRPYRGLISVSLVLLLGNSLLQIIGPLLTKLTIDRYLAPPATPITTPLDPILSTNPFVGLAQISAIYLVVLVLTFFFDFGQTYLMNLTGQRAMFDLRRNLMTHLQQLDVSYYDRNPVGRMVTRVTTDVDVLNELFTSGLVTIIGDLLMLSFVVVAMFQLSPGHDRAFAGRAADRYLCHQHFPKSSNAKLPAHTRRHRAYQLLPAGARQRHHGTATVQSRAAQFRKIRRDQPRAHGCIQRIHRCVRLVLSRGRISELWWRSRCCSLTAAFA